MLYTCDLICYGTPSPAVFQSFLAMLERRAGRHVSSYAHRGAGMRPDGDEIATFDDGAVESGTTATRVWKRIWYGYLCRESCFRCGYHSLRRPGDLTIGDWWGLAGYAPSLEDPWGVSCVVASTARGLLLLAGSRERLGLVETPVAEVANPSQPMLLHPPARGGREAFWGELYSADFEGACRKVGALGAVRSLKDHIKRISSRGKQRSNKSQYERKAGGGWIDVPMVDFGEIEERGEYPVAFAAKNRNDEVRRMSSSGGVFHALASHVICDLGGVVYGCAFDDDLRARHVRCETIVEAERCMGSKYSQSDMGNAIPMIKKDLARGLTVLFTGTPCQVAAVRAVCGDAPKR